MAQTRTKGVAMSDGLTATELRPEARDGAELMLQPLDWAEFEGRLAGALARLADDQYLILAERRVGRETVYFVQFAQTGTAGFLAEAVSNDYLVGSRQISPVQELAMLALGWLGPSKHAKGPENYHREWPLATPFDEVAALAVRTLREVYRVAAPTDLRYQRFARAGGRLIPEPSLGLEQEPRRRRKSAAGKPAPGRPGEPSLEMVVLEGIGTAAAEVGALETIQNGDPGNWSLVLDGIRVLVKVLVDKDIRQRPQAVRVFAPLLEVPLGHDLLEELNRINGQLIFGRVLHANGDVFIAAEVPLRGLTAQRIADTCSGVAQTGIQVRTELAGPTHWGPAPVGSLLPN